MSRKPLSPAEINGLIGGIYDSTLEPGRWPAVLASLCDALDAKAASINVYNPIAGRAKLIVEYGTDPAWTKLLVSTYAAMSPFGAAVLMAEVDQPVGAFDLIDEQEFVASRFYKEWCAPQDYYDMLGALLVKRADEVGSVAVTRGRDRPRFSAGDREVLGLLAPHFRRAVAIAGLLEHQSLSTANFQAVVDQLATAVLLVDPLRRLIYANPQAETLLISGSLLSRRDGRVRFADPEAERMLRHAMSAQAGSPLLIPLHQDGSTRRTAVILRPKTDRDQFAILVHEPQADLPSTGRILASIFGLTPREVAVLTQLIQGRTLEEGCEALGIAVATTKTHLQSLFSKTGTARQQDLVRVALAALPPIRPADCP